MTEPPPSPDRKPRVAYAFYAAAIWGLVAYSLWDPKPRPATSVALSCVNPGRTVLR